MLTLEEQAAFVEEAPEIFLPIPGGGGKMGHTHIRLAAASEDVLTGALRTARKLRIVRMQRQAEKTPCGGAQRSNRYRREWQTDRQGKLDLLHLARRARQSAMNRRRRWTFSP